MARGAEGTKYPPSEFSQKYAPVLAPKGKLVSPSDVFGESGVFGKDVEDKTRQAWKVTMKKLDKLNTPVDKFKDDLARERIDQVSKYFYHCSLTNKSKNYPCLNMENCLY